jgi:hypothetical protein
MNRMAWSQSTPLPRTTNWRCIGLRRERWEHRSKILHDRNPVDGDQRRVRVSEGWLFRQTDRWSDIRDSHLHRRSSTRWRNRHRRYTNDRWRHTSPCRCRCRHSRDPAHTYSCQRTPLRLAESSRTCSNSPWFCLVGDDDQVNVGGLSRFPLAVANSLTGSAVGAGSEGASIVGIGEFTRTTTDEVLWTAGRGHVGVSIPSFALIGGIACAADVHCGDIAATAGSAETLVISQEPRA